MKKKNITLFTMLLCASVLSVKAQNWSLTGNSGINKSTNFLGTTDIKPVIFRTNNLERLQITGGGKVGIATTNPKQILDVEGNINIGKDFSLFMQNHRVLSVDSSYQNIFLGNGTGSLNTSGFANTSTGYNTLYFNTDGSFNSVYGVYAMRSNTTGSYNTATGAYAMTNNTSGEANTATGTNALYYNLTGSYNVAAGYAALFRNTSGAQNTATGYYALYYNIDGGSNVANGAFALYKNTSGYGNVANGIDALYSNTIASNNTANGYRALFSNTGDNNTATGKAALYYNTTGYNNTAHGVNALFSNSSGGYNVAFGDYTLEQTTASWNNTAIGFRAGDVYDHGYNNTFIGSYTDANSGGLYNSTAIGHATVITASSQVRIGNSSVNSIGGFANWSNVSDGRIKKNIKENVPGLAFINKLKPVTYNLDLDAADKIALHTAVNDDERKQPSQTEINARNAKQQIVYTGFVAQDVEKAAKELNYDFSGLDAAKNEKDLYALRYSEFVVPLVKAVQELSKQNDELKSRLEKLEAMINVKQTTNSKLPTTSLSSASLEQNMPNPFNRTTKVNYTLPQKYSSAKIIITDNSGKTMKTVNLSGAGKGSLNVDASSLSSGTYQYSLIVDGKLIETKQMVFTK